MTVTQSMANIEPPRGFGWRVARVLRSPATLLLTYLVSVGFELWRHPLWLDEAQAWCVARDAHSLPGLFWNMRYDGHPALWYLCLFFVTRFTHNPFAMQLLHLAIAAATVALIAWTSPFTPLERWLLAFGYLFAFEYAVISRGYALGVLMVIAVCSWYAQAERRTWRITFALCLLANTSVYGTILALSLLAALAHEWRAGSPRSDLRKGGAAAAIVVIACAAAIATMKPPADYAFAREWHTRLTAERLVDTTNQLWAGWSSLPDFSTPAPWNSSIFPGHSDRPAASTLMAIAALAVLALTAWSLRKTAAAIAFYLASTAGLLAFIYLKYSAGPRHSGHLFIVLIAALWLARVRAPGARAPVDIAVRCAAALQMLAAAFFFGESLLVPFSWSADLARYVTEVSRTSPVVIADTTLVNYVGPVLSAYLRTPVDYVGPNRMRHGSFMILDEAHHREASPSSLKPAVAQYAASKGARYVLLVTSQWRHADAMGPSVAVFRRHLVQVEGTATVHVVRFDDMRMTEAVPVTDERPVLQRASVVRPQ